MKLTLFRSVGHIGSPFTLSCMSRNAGPTIETDEAQMLGELSFEYSFFFVSSLGEAIKQTSLYFKHPISLSHSAKLPTSPLKFLATHAELTAIKQAESGEGIILRCVNLSNKQDNIKIALNTEVREAWLCSLAEEPIEKLEITDDKIEVDCEPKKVLTIKFYR